MKYITYSGNLTTYFETGMEHLGLGLQVDRPEFKTPNPSYNKADPKTGPEFYLSLEGLILLKPGDRLEITTPKNTVEVFMIGNSSLAKSDQYRLGGAYPKEINSSQEELINYLNCFHQELPAKIIRPVKKIALYGGTFDPIHLGHKEIIREIHYSFDLVYILPTNNWTKKKFMFSIEERIKATQKVAKNYINVEVLDWSLVEDTTSTWAMSEKIKSQTGLNPTIVIGSDNLTGIENWKNFNELKSLPFLIFKRGELPANIPLEKAQIYPFAKNCSATEIRNKNLVDLIPPEAKTELDLTKLNIKN